MPPYPITCSRVHVPSVTPISSLISIKLSVHQTCFTLKYFPSSTNHPAKPHAQLVSSVLYAFLALLSCPVQYRSAPHYQPQQFARHRHWSSPQSLQKWSCGAHSPLARGRALLQWLHPRTQPAQASALSLHAGRPRAVSHQESLSILRTKFSVVPSNLPDRVLVPLQRPRPLQQPVPLPVAALNGGKHVRVHSMHARLRILLAARASALP